VQAIEHDTLISTRISSRTLLQCLKHHRSDPKVEHEVFGPFKNETKALGISQVISCSVFTHYCNALTYFVRDMTSSLIQVIWKHALQVART